MYTFTVKIRGRQIHITAYTDGKYFYSPKDGWSDNDKDYIFRAVINYMAELAH